MKHIIFGGFDYAVPYEMDQNAILSGIDYFVDNDTELIGTTYLGKEIKSPKALLAEKKEDILILVGSIVYKTEIFMQLKEMGFEEEKDFIWGISFVGDKECPRLWKHIEWKDKKHNADNLQQTENGEFVFSRLKTAVQLLDFKKYDTVIDLGAANERLREFLTTKVIYIPVDYVKNSKDTVICDFCKKEFPENLSDPNRTCIFAIGIIQYSHDWRWFLQKIVENCSCLILEHMDFARITREYRKTHWTRYNALFDHEIIRYMYELGFDLVDSMDFRLKSTIYKFEKRR